MSPKLCCIKTKNEYQAQDLGGGSELMKESDLMENGSKKQQQTICQTIIVN